MASSAPTAPRGTLERILALFTEVKPGEGVTALLLALNIFLVLTTYYIIKPVREALILAGGGAEVKIYTSAGQAVLLLAAVPAYAALASRLPRRPLINAVTVVFIACMLGFYVVAQAAVPYVGVAFFLWVGIFNLMIVAQFWSFANDIYTPEQGKRLFPIAGFGASLGAALGAKLAGVLIAPLGVNQMLLVSAAVLASSLLLTNVIDTRARREKRAAPARGDDTSSVAANEDEPIGKGGAFQLVLRSRYLLLIGLLLLILNWVNTTGEYILGRVVLASAVEAVEAGRSGGLDVGEYIGKFYADFFFVVNVAGTLIQLFVVSRVLKYFGVRVAIVILPLIAFGGYLFLAFMPALAIVRWAKIAENATDYSLNNTVRAVLFLPTTREQKYKAKQAIDTLFVRVGDLLSAALVFVGTAFLSFGTTQFAIANLSLVAVWLGIAIQIGREHGRLSADRGDDSG